MPMRPFATTVGAALLALAAFAPGLRAQSLCEDVQPEPPFFFSQDAVAERAPPRISKGSVVSGKLTAQDRFGADAQRSSVCRDEVYYDAYLISVQQGEKVGYAVDASGFTPTVSVYRKRDFMGMPSWTRGSLNADVRPLDASSTYSFVADEAGEMLVLVSTTTGRATGSYRLCIREIYSEGFSECGAGGGSARSSVSGLQFSAGYGTVSFDARHSSVDGGWKDSGVGPSARVGLGFDAFTVFAEGQMSQMATDGEEYDEENGYTLYHGDVGGRLYLLGSGSWLRPYVQVAYGIRRMAAQADGEDLEMEGTSLTPGAGAQLFLTPGLSIEGSFRRSSGDFTRIREAGGEWIDVPSEQFIQGATTRLAAQVVVHF
jgi:hypothetical protein